MDWAAIPKQTCLVEEGEIGDCWRCCVAAVLGLPAEKVPHFYQNDEGQHNAQADADTQKWLIERGLRVIYVPTSGGRESVCYPCYTEDVAHTPILISVGPTVRSRGRGKYHAVVTRGREVLYDPHPSNAGLTAVVEQYLIFKPVASES